MRSSPLSTRISTPVLTDLELDFGSLTAYDLYPYPLPDLFLGSQIVVVGRYTSGGTTDVTLTGRVNGAPRPSASRSRCLPAQTASLTSLPRLWATRKIGFLLNQIRLEGADQETIDQIVRLSIRYGIVTPYTSYLVTEEMPLGADAQSRIVQNEVSRAAAEPSQAPSGQAAVDKAAGQGALAGAQAPAAAPAEDRDQVRVVGARTFVLSNEVWMDTAFDPQKMKTVRVPFLSADYFALAESQPGLAAALALGERVIVLANGKAYEVVPADEPAPPLDLPATPATAPGRPTASPQPVFQVTVRPGATQVPPATALPAVPPQGAPARPTAGQALPILLGILIPVTLIVLLGKRRE